MCSICTAISNLPAELLTKEIVEAGIKEGNIGLFNCLPQVYLTPDVIEGLISRNENCYGRFPLENIPEGNRNATVCNYAVKKDISNFPSVPPKLITAEMISVLMSSAKEAFNYLPLIPFHLWTREIAYQGINSLCYSNDSNYNYGRHRHYVNNSDSEKLKFIQILLSYIPRNIKNYGFYLGMFQQKRLTSENIDFLTPKKFKQGKYYTLMATRCFKLVPEREYGYDIFMSALGPDGNSNINSSKDMEKNILGCMDDKMADVIISKTPVYFKKLPSKFKTEKRLLDAIESKGDNYYDNSLIDEKEDRSLLTEKVCKAYVANTYYLPNIPRNIWTKGFIDYCMEHAKGLSWFEQMPKELQTVDIIEHVVGKSDHAIRHARKELISLSLATKIHRDELHSSYGNLREYLPEEYYNDFVNMTGLPADFMGGEVSFNSIKDGKQNYTYCKLGDAYLGFYNSNNNVGLIMTLRTPNEMKPMTVFDRRIGTYHKTWLEKMVADYYLNFAKPKVPASLKKLQMNCYYDVVLHEKKGENMIYRNTFLGGTINFIAMKEGNLLVASTLEKMKKLL